MNLFEILTFIDDNSYFILPVGIVLLVTAAVGTTKAISGAIYAISIFIILVYTLVEIFPKAGMGALLLIGVAAAAGIIFYVFFITTSLARQKPTLHLSLALRVGVAIAGLAMVVAVDMGNDRYEIAEKKLHEAVIAGDVAQIESVWRGGTLSQAWRAVAERPQNAKTLDLMLQMLNLGIRPNNPSVDTGFEKHRDEKKCEPIALEEIKKDNAWVLVLAYPPSEKRLAVLKKMLEEHAPPVFFLVTLFDQQDHAGFALAAQSMFHNSGMRDHAVSLMIGAGCLDVMASMEAVFAAADNPRRESDSANFLSYMHLYKFLDEPEAFAHYLQAGAPLDIQEDSRQKTTLLLALERGYFEQARMLVDAGADTRLKDKAGRDALFYSVLYRDNELFIRLLDARNNIVDTDAQGTTLLRWAALAGNHEVVQILLERNIPDKEDINKALPFAVIGGSQRTLDALLARLGPEAARLAKQAAGREKYTPLALAARGLRGYTLCYYLDGSLSPGLQPRSYGLDARNNTGVQNRKILMQRKDQTVDMLLAAGADPFLPLEEQKNILHVFFYDVGKITMDAQFHREDPNHRRWCEYTIAEIPTEEYVLMLDTMLEVVDFSKAALQDISIDDLCDRSMDEKLCIAKLRTLR